MSQSILQRSIAVLTARSPITDPVRGYLLEVLEKRRHKRIRRSLEPKSLPVARLKRELDRVFSLYIRQRDCDENGIGRCITCGHPGHWKTMDCGHYCPRQDLNTRWDEKNCALQCGRCNGFRGGEAELFAKEIDKKYGNGTSELLRAKSKISLKLGRHALRMWIDHYKKLVIDA